MRTKTWNNIQLECPMYFIYMDHLLISKICLFVNVNILRFKFHSNTFQSLANRARAFTYSHRRDEFSIAVIHLNNVRKNKSWNDKNLLIREQRKMNRKFIIYIVYFIRWSYSASRVSVYLRQYRMIEPSFLGIGQSRYT